MPDYFIIFYTVDLIKNTFCWISYNGQTICFCNIGILDKQIPGTYAGTGGGDTDLALLISLGYLFCPSESSKFLQMETDNAIAEFKVI